MIASERSLLRDLALLAAFFLLALIPRPAPGAVAGFSLTLFFPGYALLRCLRTPTRVTSIPDLLHCGAASLSISPLVLRLAGLVLPFHKWNVLGVLMLLPALLLAVGTYRPRPATPARWKAPSSGFYLILALTLLLLIPTLVISPTAGGGETRIKGWDLNNHLAIAEAIATRGLPPINPFLQSASPFYYHTFFHILLGAILLLSGSGVHAYFCIALLTLFLAAIFLGTLFRVTAELTGNGRAALLALPLVSLVGGFDVLPVTGLALARGERGSPWTILLHHWNVDGWVSNRGMLVPTFFSGFYWVPHAVAALVVFLLALLFLRKTETGLGAIGVAGACLASMAGYNGYVALGGAATLALLRGVDLIRFIVSRSRFGRDVLGRSALAGATAVVLGWPVLSLYAGERGNVDKFRWARPGPLVPLQIVLEFGPALVLGLAGMEMARRHPQRRPGLMPFFLMSTVSLVLLCAVASTGENNDLAMRVSMLLWIGLAVCGGIALDRIFSAAEGRHALARGATRALLGLGGLSVAWFAVGASVAKPVLPADEVAAGRWVRSHVPPGLPVQGSPLRASPDLVYLSGHPAVLSDTWAGHLFYSNAADFSRQMGELMQALSSSDPDIACSTLSALNVAALVVGPPERAAFPQLARRRPWPCLSEAFAHGDYRILRSR